MTTAIANLLGEVFAARAAWEAHFDNCHICGRPRLCAAGSRLHTAYATLKTRVERGA